ncbi:kinase-like domain-containing protein [Dunaliella salina]|uniref:Kinase-like domain-containing protein n=1 Tax=Dunaliella salina TaxID=3046 RepID=A0ABQ7GVX5_DUNSA|nr:kinase-like domain-containing protein [Dunaliella salina]|eukprot:KAF5838700.1 kinase-like domain-containing protein [Dunaliella salina]
MLLHRHAAPWHHSSTSRQRIPALYAPERCIAHVFKNTGSSLLWAQKRASAAGTRCKSSATDAPPINEGVLKLPPRTELSPAEVERVFGYSNQLDSLFFIGRVVGAGSFGVVRECVEINSGKRFAIKSIPKKPKRGPCTPRYLLKIRAEVEIMQQLGFSLDAVNLRPDNFLFVTNDEDSQLKAIDFGLSIRHWPSEPKLNSRSGTPAYMSPELVLQNYDEKCDIWGVGMLTYQLLTGGFPYWDDVRTKSLTEVWRAILGTDIDWEAPTLASLSPSALDFLKTLLRRKPEERPSASQALEHPWIRDGGFARELPLEGTVVQRLQRFSTYGKLKQVVFSIIAEELAGESASQPLASVSNVQDLFEDIDTDHSGGVSLEELTAGLTKLGYKLTPNEIEQLLRGIDANYDGQIDLNEFVTTLLDWDELQKQQTWQTYIDMAFNKIDTDGDGYISLEELMDLIPAQPRGAAGGELERQVEARAMLREADTNEDGKISKEEFYSLLKDVQAPDTLALYDNRLPSAAVEELKA